MKKILTLCLVLFAWSGIAMAEPIGSVVQMQGTASATDQGGVSRNLNLGSDILLNDTVTTEQGSLIKIRFVDGTEIGQGENSQMVIDTYVYNPEKAEDNSFRARLMRGAFRFITDRITRLNPDRFEVRGRHGTIGIRGCDVGVRVDAVQDQVFVIDLHHADSVVVGMSDSVQAGRDASQQPVVVRRGSQLVSVDAVEGVQRRVLQPGSLRRLKMETGEAGERLQRGAVDPGDEGGAQQQQSNNEAETSGGGLSPEIKRLVATAVSSEGALAQVAAPAPTPVPSAPSPLPQPVQVDVVQPEPEPEAAPVVEDEGPAGPIVRPIVRTARGGGTDWSWGVWEQETITIENGSEVSTFMRGADVSGNRLSAAAFDALAAGPAQFLSGTGVAAAGVTTDGSSVLLEGSSALNLSFGGGTAPVWDGTFSMGGDGTLNFTASGSIAGGALSGTLNSYNLSVPAGSFGLGDVASQNINGSLVGPGTGAQPVTGAIGNFDINHGAARVQGIFGADVR